VNIINPVVYLESRYQIQLKKVGRDEYAGPCPWCGGEDRFHVWERGNYWCRPGPGHCGKEGWVDTLDGNELTPEQRRLLALEAKQREMERRQEEHDRRLSALERMAKCTDHLSYHRALDWQAIDYWHREGMTNATIDTHKLGYCARCPTDRDGRASYTIPVYGRDGSTLINIRHRLVMGPSGDKYRPHLAGLGAQLFNSRYTATPGEFIIITEGEKKSLVLEQEGLPNVAIMGKRSFNKEWLKWMEPFATVYVALDPDAQESARRLAALFSGRGRVVRLPCKVDDMVVRYGATGNDVMDFMRLGYPVDGNRKH